MQEYNMYMHVHVYTHAYVWYGGENVRVVAVIKVTAPNQYG